jgi:hypothetical protein
LGGLMVDKLAIGSPSEFADCTTADQVIDRLLSEQSAAAALQMLDHLREMIEQRAANAATVVQTPPPTQRPGDELARSLALFQKHRR